MVRYLNSGEHARATEVLADAFEANRTVSYFLGGNRPELRRSLFGITSKARVKLGVPIPATVDQGVVQGVSLLTLPDGRAWDDELDAEWEALEAATPKGLSDRMAEYMELHERHCLPEPHVYLVALAVDPQAHRRGYGGMMIDETIRMARQMGAPGVGLDTDTESNRLFYERRGFDVLAEVEFADGPMWFMYRPSDRTA